MINCPVCETQKNEKEYIKTCTSNFNNQEYKLYRCPNCTLEWWEPLKIIPEYYEQEEKELYLSLHLGLDELQPYHKPFFTSTPIKSGRLLDVGCGAGAFLLEAQKLGFEVWGIDFDSKSVKACREIKGLKNVFALTPQEFAEYCQRENLKFDVITFFEVLEHQDKPMEFLKTIKSMLKPGGYIAGSVPNRNRFFKRIDLKFYEFDFPPQHFLWFDDKTLSKTLEKIGFEDILVKTISPYGISEITLYLEFLVLGDLAVKIHNKLKSYAVKTIPDNVVSAISVDRIYKENPGLKSKVLVLLKGLRNSVLFAPAVILKYLARNRGPGLFFIGRNK